MITLYPFFFTQINFSQKKIDFLFIKHNMIHIHQPYSIFIQHACQRSQEIYQGGEEGTSFGKGQTEDAPKKKGGFGQ